MAVKPLKVCENVVTSACYIGWANVIRLLTWRVSASNQSRSAKAPESKLELVLPSDPLPHTVAVTFSQWALRTGATKKEERAVTLTEVKDASCFKTMCSRGITVVIHLTANAVYHCPCSSSQPRRCALVIKWQVLLSSERRAHKAPSSFLTLALHEATGGVRSCTHSPSLVSHPSLFPSFPGLP